MADFIKLDKDKYSIKGILSEEDINRINTMKNRTLLIMENTAGLSSELVRKITGNNIFFSIKGGLDYDNIKKYNSDHYKERTYMSPKGLAKVISYFENIENQMRPEWNDVQKALFAYGSLAEDIKYEENFDNMLGSGIAERSLNGLLYGKLVCAGYALVFKEMMDRLNIKCYYHNQKNVHGYNVLEFDGKYYGVDVTWDSVGAARNNGECQFSNFGIDKEFYSRNGHSNIINDGGIFRRNERLDLEEKRYDLSVFSNEELVENLKVIYPYFLKRKKIVLKGFAEQSEEVKRKYLPIDTVRYELLKESEKERQYFEFYRLIKNKENLNIDQNLLNAFLPRCGYILDTSSRPYSSKDDNLAIWNYGCRYEDIVLREARVADFVGDEREKRELLDNICNEMTKFFERYLADILEHADYIVDSYEERTEDMDENRITTSVDLSTKMSTFINSRDYLINHGYDKELIDSICKKFSDKIIYKPTEEEIAKEKEESKKNCLDFAYCMINDLVDVKRTMETFEGRDLTDEEFYSRFINSDYMLNFILDSKVFSIKDLEEDNISIQEFEDVLKQILIDNKVDVSKVEVISVDIEELKLKRKEILKEHYFVTFSSANNIMNAIIKNTYKKLSSVSEVEKFFLSVETMVNSNLLDEELKNLFSDDEIRNLLNEIWIKNDLYNSFEKYYIDEEKNKADAIDDLFSELDEGPFMNGDDNPKFMK